MTVRILTGDCREMLATMPERSVQCVVTSPPYFGLRDYGTPGQMGLEPTLAEYISGMVAVFREVRRVLRDDGTVWLNCGDSYNANGRIGHGTRIGFKQGTNRASANGADHTRASCDSLKPKDLMMVPARLAIALQDDGWYLRSDIIWAKPNPMPESVRDRPTSAHEHIFLLTKQARYYFDQDAVRERNDRSDEVWPSGGAGKSQSANGADRNDWGRLISQNPNGANIRNVWSIATQPFSGAHFAVFPPEIPRRCILAGTSEKGECPACGKPWVRVVEKQVEYTSGSGKAGNVPNGKYAGTEQAESGTYDIRMGPSVKTETTGWQPSCPCDAGDPVPQTVLDPFLGAGTTLLVADRLGRHGVGIELSPEYADMARRRITNDAPLFAMVAD